MTVLPSSPVRPLLVAVLIGCALATLTARWVPARADPGEEQVRLPDSSSAPVPGRVATGFAPPEQRWGAGHRGVDLTAEVGSPVRAAAAGTVTFASRLAGRGVVTVDHGSVRTTYEPVRAQVVVGQRVTEGQVIGVLEPGHACGASPCLHWGLKHGEDYLDPTLLLGPGSSVRLLPTGSLTAARTRAVARQAVAVAARASGPVGAVARSGLVRPVVGAVTSPFGMRRHPVTGVVKLHDGVDWGSPCGTPVGAAQDGVVVERRFNAAWGNRVVIDHGTVNGRALRTSYNHLSAFAVEQGARVRRGQVVGRVGSTGFSTGCHLHLQLWNGGSIVDPGPWFA